ncbi:MAG: single-stranded DNA-binding protein [Clostridiales bacterium]|nr:single-stranded DNA-binding protein [Clostridiales bacterium]
MNKVFLIGRLTADPKQGQTPGNKVYTRFALAVNRYNSEDADFINIIAWEKTAEVIIKYAAKGRQIAVTGHIQTGTYEKNGEKRPTFDVVAENVELLGAVINADRAHPKDASIDDLEETDDDDMPF